MVTAICSAGCSEDVVVLASIPAGATPASGTRCVDSSECAPGTFCDRRRCHETAGICVPFPVSCIDDERPVCGCDGITYFNDCLRRAAGVEGSDADECTQPAGFCGRPGESCPEGAVCAKLTGFGGPSMPDCRGPVVGRCWVLPATCPPPGRADRWDECSEEPGALRCTSTCSAIRSGRSFVRANRCQ